MIILTLRTGELGLSAMSGWGKEAYSWLLPSKFHSIRTKDAGSKESSLSVPSYLVVTHKGEERKVWINNNKQTYKQTNVLWNNLTLHWPLGNTGFHNGLPCCSKCRIWLRLIQRNGQLSRKWKCILLFSEPLRCPDPDPSGGSRWLCAPDWQGQCWISQSFIGVNSFLQENISC